MRVQCLVLIEFEDVSALLNDIRLEPLEQYGWILPHIHIYT
jgi:hypothetical protein